MATLIIGMLMGARQNFESTNCSIAPSVNFYQDEPYGADEHREDTTTFEFKFKNKIWKFNAEDFLVDSNQFDINYKLNKYKLNNDKNQKIKLIKQLNNLKINSKTIANYIFPNINKKIANIENNIKKAPKNAYFQYKNKLNIISGVCGININFDLFYKKLINNYLISDNIRIEIPTIKTMPEVSSTDLKMVSNLIGEFSTSYSKSTLDRKHNIKVALSKINATRIESGEQFSFNKVVGKRTKENGFRMAKIINAGEFVDGYGGGVCQVSTTLYNAVLLAGLKIDKANKHSEKIGYVMTGFDAMVNWGTSDFVFTNNTSGDIYIFTDYTESQMSIKIFGVSKNGLSYKLRNEILDKRSAGKCQEVVDVDKKYYDRVRYTDESFYLKTAHDGFTVKSYRDTYMNGEFVKAELIRTDKYAPQSAIKIIGAEEREQPIEEFASSICCVSKKCSKQYA